MDAGWLCPSFFFIQAQPELAEREERLERYDWEKGADTRR
jgi:hypothetical protein